MQVVVMAAGLGKRMRSSVPKMLHPLAGRPMLAYGLDAARSLAPRAVAVVVGQGADQVRSVLAAPDLTFVTQDPPRGTGDAVRVALEALPHDGVTVVTNGDCPLLAGFTLRALADLATEDKVALLTAHAPDPAGLGRIVRDGAGNVRAIVEDRDATPAQRAIGEVYAGTLAAPTHRLERWVNALTPHNAQGEFYLTDVIAAAVRDGVPVVAHVAEDERETRGINDRAQLAAVERIVQQRRAHALMVAGVSIVDPARIDIRGTLECGRDVTIDVGCVFEGRVRLAEGARVGPYCVLRDVTVGERTEILPYTHMEGAEVGAGARVGPFARVRPGSQLGERVHIGNFVEVKSSSMGAGSKANHLAYVGDSQVASDVNIGAGVITANYDGASKHRTVIGEGAHIGSNAVLVAPVTIGPGATIAASTTVTEDAPPDALTVGRARPTTIPGWKRPRKPPDVK